MKILGSDFKGKSIKLFWIVVISKKQSALWQMGCDSLIHRLEVEEKKILEQTWTNSTEQ